MKVYATYARHDTKGCQLDSIVAAANLTEAAKLFGISRQLLSSRGGETGNRQQIEIAMSRPGVVFSRIEREQYTAAYQPEQAA